MSRRVHVARVGIPSPPQLVSRGPVGVPGPGEKVCGRCRGHGLLNKHVINYPGYEVCEPCSGTGVRKL